MGLIRSGNTVLTPEDDDDLTEYLWPIVKEIIKTAIENRQNLIVEGCYVPLSWRKDFDEGYLPSAIESRLSDADCTMDSLKTDNRKFINGFQQAAEQVVIIDSNYEQTIKALLI